MTPAMLKAYTSGKPVKSDPAFQAALTATLSEFQAALPAEHPFREDLATLERFLIARKFNVDDATGMLNAHVSWRAATLPVKLTDPVRSDLRMGKYYQYGTDLNGNAVIVVRSGLFNKERKLDEATSAIIYILESALQQSELLSVLYDRENFSIAKNLDIELIKTVAKILGDNYPERLKGVYLYPTGLVFKGIWNMVSPFLDPRTRGKVHMLQNKSDFLKYFDASGMETRYGGTLAPFDGASAYL